MRHCDIHSFPSIADIAHYALARAPSSDPVDQATLPRPRLGYCGIIDARIETGLLAGIAAARPEWQLVMLGPVIAIDPGALPQAPNIHYLGQKSYDDQPRYIGFWDVAILPFAQNEAARFVSPTKAPGYLAAGKPVVATPIRDVVSPHADLGLIAIANGVDSFVAAVETALRRSRDPTWLEAVDGHLAQ